jgi:hypothetical protein
MTEIKVWGENSILEVRVDDRTEVSIGYCD